MPHYEEFAVTTSDAMADFELDRPDDPGRVFEGGDDMLNGVGDALTMNLPAWNERLDAYQDDFALFGSVCEVYEYLWRIIGSENALLWLAAEPEKTKAFVEVLGDFLVKFAAAQIKAADGRLDGMYIWGDIAYVKGMFFSPKRWREVFKPCGEETDRFMSPE